MESEDDSFPLVAEKNRKFCRTASCFGEPNESALNFVINDDLEKLTSLLAEVCQSSDEKNPEHLPEDHWINLPFDKEANLKTLLHLAVEKSPEHRAENFARVLISAGARPDLYNEYLGLAPIHVAAKLGYIKVVKLLVDFSIKLSRSSMVVNSVDASGTTALHIAVSKNNQELLRYLLTREELEIDPEDFKGRRTPLYLAAKSKQREIVKLLIGDGASIRNVCYGKSIEDLLQENLPDLRLSIIEVVRKRPIKEDFALGLERILDKASMNRYKGLSNAQNHLHFVCLVRKVSRKDLNTHNAGGMTLLQKGCANGLSDFVSCLLEAGADPTAVTPDCGSAPVLQAAFHGHQKVLNVLMEHKQNSTESISTVDFATPEKSSRETVLHWILKRPDPDQSYEEYEACFKTLMSEPRVVDDLKKVINTKDISKNTPLHYATQLWPQEVVRQILELGANIGIRNLRDEIPISKILPSTMESFLNEFCLTSKKAVTDGEFAITFNYSFLAPPVESKTYDEKDEEGQKLVEKAALPETESLWHMTMSKPHRHLIKHPVITSFLHLKWRRIYGYFNRNLRFYVMFVLCSTWYIFERFGGTSLMSNPAGNFCKELKNSFEPTEKVGFWYIFFCVHFALQAIFMITDWNREIFSRHESKVGGSKFGCIFNVFFATWLETLTLGLMVSVLYFSTSVLWLVITILLVLLMAREIFQMSVSLKRYACTPENWLEVCVIGFMGFILWCPDDLLNEPCDAKRHLAAVTIVASWAELVTFVARHPRLSRYNIYVTMFYKVLKTFFFFLAWYFFFVLAFALGFYIMLHRDTSDDGVPEDVKNATDYYKFFDDPFLSMVKTTTMFVGEIEFSDVPVDSSWLPISYLFLLAFVFLIIVVLMNLLNGLAVSDTGIIREKAETVSYTSRVDTISYIESLLLGDPFNFLSNWPPIRWIRSLPSLSLCRCICQRNETVKHLTHKLTGATGILIFYSILQEKTLTVFPNKGGSILCYGRRSSNVELPREILESAKNLIIEQQECKRQQIRSEQVEDRISGIMNKVEALEKNINKIMTALKIKH